jgi:coenzyme F420-reducing hydrogenase beta subunit
MAEDEEGFQYPVIHKENCAHCGLCLNACPAYNARFDKAILKKPRCYSAYASDECICRQSSSGGIFSLIANYVLSKGGVVFGAVSLKIDYVKHIKVSSYDELPPVRKSKYLQSDIGLSYRDAEEELKKDKVLLYTGTPCQIAGLRSFLGRDYDTLITCDLMCMGVPSAMVFRKFLLEMRNIYKSEPTAYYRDKSKGWAPVVFSMEFKNRSSVSFLYENNMYNHGFKAHLFQRPTCSLCKFASIPRIGDISLGDDWDYYRRFKYQKEKLQRGVSYIPAFNPEVQHLAQ